MQWILLGRILLLNTFRSFCLLGVLFCSNYFSILTSRIMMPVIVPLLGWKISECTQQEQAGQKDIKWRLGLM
jgi:nucleoside permease NupC